MAEFTPEQEKEFEFRQRYEQEQAQQQPQAQSAADAKDVESATNSVVYPAVAAGAAAASGNLPSKIVNGMVQDPVTGKWMAVENYGRQMAQGKYYGGKNYNQVWDKIREFNADPTQGPRLEKEAMANRSTGQKVLSKIPKPLQGIASSPFGALGKGIMGLGAGMQGADALNRYNEGDTSGAIISGLGALGTTAAMLPHPVARIVGTGVGLGAEGLNMFLDKLKNKKQMAKGGLVDEEDGLSKAEKAALRIMKKKNKTKRFAEGGSVMPEPQVNPTSLQPEPPEPPVQTTSEPGIEFPSPLNWVSQFYRQSLGREADQPGLDFWAKSIESGQNSIDDVRNAIQNSDEGQRYGINQLYKNALGREADQPGFDFWLNALRNGTSINDVNDAFYNSDEYQNAHQRPTVPEVDPISPTFDPNIRDNNGVIIGSRDPKPEVRRQDPIVDPVWFDENGEPHMGYNPNPQPKPDVPPPRLWEPPGPDIFDENGNVIGQRTEEERMTPPQWYIDQFVNAPNKLRKKKQQFII